MNEPNVELAADELWAAARQLDLLAVVIDELVTGSVQDGVCARRPAIRLTPARSSGWALLRDEETGARCRLPLEDLHAVRLAALTALAAQRMLAHAVVTAAVLGSVQTAELLAATLVRLVPAVNHVALWVPAGPRPESFGRRLRDELDLIGVGLRVTEHPGQAVSGANLIVAGSGSAAAHVRPQARGAVVVNGAGHDLPAQVLLRFDQVYVDDLRLLPDRGRRHLTARKGATPAGHSGNPCLPRPVESDLVHVTTGAHPGRTSADDVVLVDLLSAQVLSAELAHQLHQIALRTRRKKTSP